MAGIVAHRRTACTQRAPAALLVRTFVTALLLLFPPAGHPGELSSEEIDALAARVLEKFEVPGLSVAIVKDNRVVLARGYGVRKLGEPDRVDEETLFPIASNTKAFTATALGLLVEEGKLTWDEPVIQSLPWFQLSDPYVTRELTVRDLLVHRSGLGLGAGDLLWWPPSRYSRGEIARRLKQLPLSTSFRSAYAYDNVLYLVAGEVIEAVAGKTWEEIVQERILDRVGMKRSVARLSLLGTLTNCASPHCPLDGAVRTIRPFAADATDPAGGILSCASDMGRWMLVQLARGKLEGGARLFSENTARELQTLVTPIPIVDPPPELAALRPNFSGYALGFAVRDYRGHKVVTHTGGLPGYVSRVFLIPALSLGITVLTNQESGAAFDALVYQIADSYLGAPPVDWLASFAALKARETATGATLTPTPGREGEPVRGPSLALGGYAGRYRDAWYGEVAITLESGHLAINLEATPLLVGDLEHWQHDTFIVRWKDRELRADAFITFALTPDGAVEQARMKAVSPETDFSFDFHDLLLRPVRR